MSPDEHHAALVAYLKAKVEAGDWHGVSDAANDLRVIEAQIQTRPMTATEVMERTIMRGRKPQCNEQHVRSVSPFVGRCVLDHGHTGEHFAQGYGRWSTAFDRCASTTPAAGVPNGFIRCALNVDHAGPCSYT